MAHFVDVKIIHKFMKFPTVAHINRFSSEQVPRIHLSRADDLYLVIIEGVDHRYEPSCFSPGLNGHLRHVLDEQGVKVGAEFEIVCRTQRSRTELFEGKHGQFSSCLWHNQLPTQELKDTR